MGCISELVVLAIFVTWSSARYVHSNPKHPRIQGDDSSYPTALGKKIVASLTPEQLKMFNKEFVVDRDSESAVCPYDLAQIIPNQAKASDGLEYYLPLEPMYQQNFPQKKCNYTKPSGCMPPVGSSTGQCHQLTQLQEALVIPVPKHGVYIFKGELYYLNGTLYRDLGAIEKMIHIADSECSCVIKENW